MQKKHPSSSETIKTEVVCPNDTNPMGIVQGGRLVEWMDIAAAICAQLHSGKVCVTASIHKVNFHLPARVGDIVLIKAKINRAFNTSMEIGTTAWLKLTGKEEMELIGDAFFTFVALSTDGKPVSIIGVEPQTTEEIMQFDTALLRRKA